MNYEVEETVAIANVKRDSVYKLKYRALKKFKDAIETLEE
jgi:hypothetical protein